MEHKDKSLEIEKIRKTKNKINIIENLISDDEFHFSKDWIMKSFGLGNKDIRKNKINKIFNG